MATPLYGVNATKRAAVPAQKVPTSDERGKMRILYDEFTSAVAVIANAEEILMMKIPKDARLVEALIYADDHGTTGTFTVGWKASTDALEAADANGIFDTVDCKTAAVSELMSADEAHAGILKKFAAEVQAYILMTEATDVSTAKSFKLALTIVQD